MAEELQEIQTLRQDLKDLTARLVALNAEARELRRPHLRSDRLPSQGWGKGEDTMLTCASRCW